METAKLLLLFLFLGILVSAVIGWWISYPKKRNTVLELLVEGEMTGADIIARLSKQWRRPFISITLTQMREHGLIESRDGPTFLIYRLTQQGKRIRERIKRKRLSVV